MLDISYLYARLMGCSISDILRKVVW
jgi:hypothetical protein